MKICRYQLSAESPINVGLVENNCVFDVSAAIEYLPPIRWPAPPGDLFISHLETLKPIMQELASKAEPIPVNKVKLKAPIANPGKFLCGGGNHKIVLQAGAHPRDIGLLFKMTSALAGPADGVTLRWPERITFHEMEIAIIIGKEGIGIPASEALNYVAGYAIGLDMTMQGKEDPCFGKSFDSYGVIGPWLVTSEEIPDPSVLEYELRVNSELRQKDSANSLVLDVPHLIEHAASVMTLHPGDVIFSGTPPASVGPVVPGDIMHAKMDGIGEFSCEVRGGPGRIFTE